jgi:hypothetical protein
MIHLATPFQALPLWGCASRALRARPRGLAALSSATCSGPRSQRQHARRGRRGRGRRRRVRLAAHGVLDTGTNEVTGGSPAYARVALTWAAASGGVQGSCRHAADVERARGTTVGWWGLWTLVTGGTLPRHDAARRRLRCSTRWSKSRPTSPTTTSSRRRTAWSPTTASSSGARCRPASRLARSTGSSRRA